MSYTIIERFWQFVDKTGSGAEACWLWTGACNEAGYGKFHVNVTVGTLLAHRWSFMMHHKKAIDDDSVLDHLCKNRRCVRPSHLDLVSHALNVARGDSVTSDNKRKDTCHKGHPFDATNTYRSARGRQCRQCMREANERYANRHPEKVRERVRSFRQRRA